MQGCPGVIGFCKNLRTYILKTGGGNRSANWKNMGPEKIKETAITIRPEEQGWREEKTVLLNNKKMAPISDESKGKTLDSD